MRQAATTGLDAKARRSVWKTLEALKEQGLTIFLTSHFMDEVEALCDEIAVRRAVLVTLGALTAFMVVGWLISGVHWLTDIIGGVLLSVGLVMLYAFATKRQGKSRKNSLAFV